MQRQQSQYSEYSIDNINRNLIIDQLALVDSTQCQGLQSQNQKIRYSVYYPDEYQFPYDQKIVLPIKKQYSYKSTPQIYNEQVQQFIYLNKKIQLCTCGNVPVNLMKQLKRNHISLGGLKQINNTLCQNQTDQEIQQFLKGFQNVHQFIKDQIQVTKKSYFYQKNKKLEQIEKLKNIQKNNQQSQKEHFSNNFNTQPKQIHQNLKYLNKTSNYPNKKRLRSYDSIQQKQKKTHIKQQQKGIQRHFNKLQKVLSPSKYIKKTLQYQSNQKMIKKDETRFQKDN